MASNPIVDAALAGPPRPATNMDSGAADGLTGDVPALYKGQSFPITDNVHRFLVTKRDSRIEDLVALEQGGDSVLRAIVQTYGDDKAKSIVAMAQDPNLTRVRAVQLGSMVRNALQAADPFPSTNGYQPSGVLKSSQNP